jgi:hypothetical protein
VNDRAPRARGPSGGGHWSIGGTAPPETPEVEAEEKKAQDSQRRAGVSLAFRLQNARRIVPGEALVLELGVRGLSAKAGATQVSRLGSASNPWAGQIEFKKLAEDGKAQPLAMKVRLIGGAEPQIELKPGTDQRALFAVDGLDTANLSPDTHRMVVMITSGKTVFNSRSLTLEVVDPARLSAADRKEADLQRKLSPAFVEFAAGRWADAEKIARAVCAEAFDSLEAQLLLARSLDKQGKLKEAYETYQRALALTGRLYEPPYVIYGALERLEEKLGIDPKPPEIDPKSAMAAPKPGFEHALHGETPAGKSDAPFSSASTTRLALDWKLAPTAPGNLVEIRWIAADTGGAAPKDTVITTSKSDAGKTEGTFTLSKPTNGFPPGSYRIEIWQSGKIIHSEAFSIAK